MCIPVDATPDYYEWLKTQEILLRNKQFDKLDLERLTAEIGENISRVEGQLSRAIWLLLIHLTKWAYQPRKPSMTNTMEVNIRICREDVKKVLFHSPSLKSMCDSELDNAYQGARKVVSLDMNMSLTVLPEECPWTSEQIFDARFFPPSQAVIR